MPADIHQHAALPFPQSLPDFQRLFPAIVPIRLTPKERAEQQRIAADKAEGGGTH